MSRILNKAESILISAKLNLLPKNNTLNKEGKNIIAVVETKKLIAIFILDARANKFFTFCHFNNDIHCDTRE